MQTLRSVVAVTALAGAAGALWAPAPDAGATPAPSIDWRTELEPARAEARQSGKPLLITFR